MWKSLTRISAEGKACTNVFAHSKDVDVGTALKVRSLLLTHKLSTQGAVKTFKTGSSSLRCFSTLFNNCQHNTLKSSVLASNRSIIRSLPFQQQHQKKCIHTSLPKNALPPIVVMVIGRVAKMGAVIFGRTLRKWWQKLPSEEKAAYAKKAGRNRYIISGILGALAFGSFIYYDSHIQETPFTNRKRFLAFTTAQIMEMAKMELDVLLQVNEKHIISAKLGTAIYRRIVKVAQQLLQANQDLAQIHELEWTVTVVDDENQMNAFVLPCGSIFVFSGLLKLCDSDDQLGIILGHEMAHAVMGHGAEKASFMHFMDLLFVVPLAALWALLPSDLTAIVASWISSTISKILMDLPHSRFIEEEADEVGLVLAAKACFDIREAPVVWAKMSLTKHDEFPIEWLSTHPSNEKRQAQLEAMLPDALAVREKCQCPRLPHLDPRLKIEAYQKMIKSKSEQRKEHLLVPLKIDPATTRVL